MRKSAEGGTRAFDVAQKPDPEQLRALALFGGISDEALHSFAECADVLEVPAGEAVYFEGDPARSLFVVVTGSLAVTKRGDGEEHELHRLRAGDFFGEMSFVDMQPRSATVRAVETCVLWAWPYQKLCDTYRQDGKTYTLLIMNIARELSRRLRRADQVITAGRR